MRKIDVAIIALIGTAFGGVGLKVMEHWLGRAKVRYIMAQEERREVQEEVRDLRREVKDHDKQLDIWRDKYYESLEELLKTRLHVGYLNTRLEQHGEKVERLPGITDILGKREHRDQD